RPSRWGRSACRRRPRQSHRRAARRNRRTVEAIDETGRAADPEWVSDLRGIRGPSCLRAARDRASIRGRGMGMRNASMIAEAKAFALLLVVMLAISSALPHAERMGY